MSFLNPWLPYWRAIIWIVRLNRADDKAHVGAQTRQVRQDETLQCRQGGAVCRAKGLRRNQSVTRNRHADEVFDD